jgi:hypothetical protein
MKLNHVSTFLGKGQPEIWFKELDSRLEDFRKEVAAPGVVHKAEYPIKLDSVLEHRTMCSGTR